MDEALHTFPKYPGYGVTLSGKFWSYKNDRWLDGCVLNNGYIMYSVNTPGLRVPQLGHRLMAEIFLATWNPKLQVNHKDGNKLNNHISNLEMCTPSQNKLHAYKLGLCPDQRGSKNNASKLNDEEVRLIKTHMGILQDSQLARMFGLNPETIRQIRLGNTWRHV